MCNRRVFRLVYLLALPLDRSPWLCPYRCLYLCCLCFCPWLGPVRFGSVGSVPNEERSIHLNVCHLLRCRRNVCLFAGSASSAPSSLSISLSLPCASFVFYFICFSLLLVFLFCLFFFQTNG